MFILLVGRMFIYMLQYEGLVLYVGKTKNMKNRYSKHCNRKDSCGSRNIPDDFHWTMVLLEECEDVLATSREQHFFDTLKPLYNKQRPGQSRREYQRTHPEAHKESCRKWIAAHAEQNREAKRKYHAANRETRNAKQRERVRAKKQLNAVPTTPPQTEVAV